MPSIGLRRASALPLLLLTAVLAGCHHDPSGSAPETSRNAAAEQRELANSVRAELATIPPPTKARFASVRSLEQWRNPYLTVQDNLLVLHVTVADSSGGNDADGSLLRPIAARQQVLTIHITELPAALNAIPTTAWPYGRVLAVEEAHNTPKAAEPAVRRTLEGVMRTLTDLGVVVYEWTESGPEIR